MKKRKLGAMVLAATMCTGMLTGCSAKDLFAFPSFGMNAEKVLSKSATAMSEIESCTIGMSMKYDTKVSAKEDDGSTQSVPVNMSLDKMTMDVMLKEGDLKYAHLDGVVGVSFMGLEQTVPLKSYLVADKDVYTSYTSTDGTTWDVSESDSPDDADTGVDVDKLLDFKDSGDDWTMNKKKEELGKTKVYHLTKSVSSDDLKDIMSLNMDDLYQSLGMSSVETPGMTMDLYVDADNFYVVKMAVGLDKSDDKKLTVKSDDMSVTFNDMSLDVTYDNFNSVKKSDVKVPDSVVSLAKESTGSDSVIGALESGGTDFGVDDDYKTVADGTKTDGKYTAKLAGYNVSFEPFDKISGSEYISDKKDYYSISSKDSRYEVTLTDSEYFDGKDTVTEEQQASNTYFNECVSKGEMKELYIGDVKSTNVGKFTAYYYNYQYTHVDSQADYGYVCGSYKVYLDAGDEKCIEVEITEMTSEGENTSLDESLVESVLSHISISK